MHAAFAKQQMTQIGFAALVKIHLKQVAALRAKWSMVRPGPFFSQ